MLQSRFNQSVSPVRPNTVTRSRNWCVLLVCMVFVGLALMPQSLLPEQWTFDSQSIEDIGSGAQVVEDSGSYYFSAKIFSALGPLSIPFICVIGFVSIRRFFGELKSPQVIWLALFIAIPAFLFGMVRPQKEVFVVVLTLFVAAIDFSSGRQWQKLLLLVAAYSVYASTMRTYFFLIPVVFLILLAMRPLSSPARAMFLLCMVIAINFVPLHVLQDLQGARDDVNSARVLTALNVRTAFFNPIQNIEGVTDFLWNYAYAAIFLNGAFFFFFDISSLILTVTTGIYLYLAHKGYSSDDTNAGVKATLFLSHLCVLTLFEPDLGSYLRHASSAFVYLAPALVILDTQRRLSRSVRV